MDYNRVTEIYDSQRKCGGTGYLIRPTLILTAHHVVAPLGQAGVLGTTYDVRLIGDFIAGLTDWLKNCCQLCWDAPDEKIDLALLKLDSQQISENVGDSPIKFGRMVADEIFANGYGFPEVQVIENRQNPYHLKGYLNSITGTKEGQLTLEVTSPVPGHPSEWEGISGAAVFGENSDIILGVIVETNKGFTEKVLWAVPISIVAENVEFSKLVTGAQDVSLPLIDVPQRKFVYGAEAYHRMRRRIHNNASRFIGKEKELEHIVNYLNSHDNNPLIVLAPAGFGKTSLLAYYSEEAEKDTDVVSHFFSKEEELVSIRECLWNILRQIGEIYDLDLMPSSWHDEVILKDYLFDLLNRWDEKSGRKLVIIIDGLDEAEKFFYQPFPIPLPELVKVVASLRRDPSREIAKDWDCWLKYENNIELKPLCDTELKLWLCESGDKELSKLSRDRIFISKLANKTQRLPLYVHYIIDEMLYNKGDEANNLRILNESPKGLQAYVQRQVKLLARDKNRRSKLLLLGLILASPTPIKTDVLIECLPDEYAEDIISPPWSLNRWLVKSANKLGEHEYSFAHPLLSEKFEEMSVVKSIVNKSRQRLINFCFNAKKIQNRWNEYALLNLPMLLHKAHQFKELYNLARDKSFVHQVAQVCLIRSDFSSSPSKVALKVAINIKDAEAIAEFSLRHSFWISNILKQTPISVLNNMSLDSALALCDLMELGLNQLWKLFLSLKLKEKHNEKDAQSVLNEILKGRIIRQKGERAICAAVCMAGLIDSNIDETILVNLAESLFDKNEISATSCMLFVYKQMVMNGKNQMVEKRKAKNEEVQDNITNIFLSLKYARKGDVYNALKEFENIKNERLKDSYTIDFIDALVYAKKYDDAKQFLKTALKHNWSINTNLFYKALKLRLFLEAQKILESFPKNDLYRAENTSDLLIALDKSKLFADPELLWKELIEETQLPKVQVESEQNVEQLSYLIRNESRYNAFVQIARIYALIGNLEEAKNMFEIAKRNLPLSEKERNKYLHLIARAQVGGGDCQSALKTISNVSRYDREYILSQLLDVEKEKFGLKSASQSPIFDESRLIRSKMYPSYAIQAFEQDDYTLASNLIEKSLEAFNEFYDENEISGLKEDAYSDLIEIIDSIENNTDLLFSCKEFANNVKNKKNINLKILKSHIKKDSFESVDSLIYELDTLGVGKDEIEKTTSIGRALGGNPNEIKKLLKIKNKLKHYEIYQLGLTSVENGDFDCAWQYAYISEKDKEQEIVKSIVQEEIKNGIKAAIEKAIEMDDKRQSLDCLKFIVKSAKSKNELLGIEKKIAKIEDFDNKSFLYEQIGYAWLRFGETAQFLSLIKKASLPPSTSDSDNSQQDYFDKVMVINKRLKTAFSIVHPESANSFIREIVHRSTDRETKKRDLEYLISRFSIASRKREIYLALEKMDDNYDRVETIIKLLKENQSEEDYGYLLLNYAKRCSWLSYAGVTLAELGMWESYSNCIELAAESLLSVYEILPSLVHFFPEKAGFFARILCEV